MRVAPILFGFLCLGLLSLYVLPTLGELLAIGPRNQISERAKPNELPSNTDWRDTYNVLLQAAKLDAFDLQMQFELGRLALWQAHYVNTSPSERRQWLDTSVTHLRRALSGRPTWGQAWAELAFVQVQRGKPLEAHAALLKAMHYEPYEGHTQWMVLATGFAIWPMLYGENQERFMDIVRHALAAFWVERVVVPAVHYGRENVIGPLVRDNERAEKMLRQKLAKRDRN